MPARRDGTDRRRNLWQLPPDRQSETQSAHRHQEFPAPDSSASVDSSPLAPPAPFSPAKPSSPAMAQRWLCSELLNLGWVDAHGHNSAITVNLEEIWREGAQVEAEEALPEGLPVRLTKDPEDHAASSFPGELRGVVTACLDSGTGFAVEIVFSPGYAWQPESFPLSHGVNTADLERKAAEARNHTLAAEDSPNGPGSVADCEKRASAARAVAETVEQGSLYQLASHSANR